eukprot:TRINITY_DN90259_c0_g1_i1.p1 TRINITY_DN90259_c0_g1~~TRINITY_DN90259_c0_g1_i1.p1  ORF type:complete len:429 (+),score=82.61 TRINITY_DN90259_c0_g1_i1:74-1360(+)
MVVQYPTAAEESPWSFLSVTPRVLLWRTGSVIPHLAPQILLTIFISCVAILLEREELIGEWAEKGLDKTHASMGFLLAFLLVFKTQSAYNQFWAATDHVDTVLEESRLLAMAAVTAFREVKDSEIDVDREGKRLVRLLVAHYFVVIEFFQRSGMNSLSSPEFKDLLRQDVRRVLGEDEYKELYPGEEYSTPGSHSQHIKADPTILHFWMQMCLSNVLNAGGCPPPVIGSLMGRHGKLVMAFWSMNKIDKTQFPLPYAQIVKLLCVIYVFSLPFHVVHTCGRWTPAVAVLLAVGFFGLDQVAEVLETPFGNSPNDINMRLYGRKLMKDLAMMYHLKDQKSDTFFASEEKYDLQMLYEEYSTQVDNDALTQSQTVLTRKALKEHRKSHRLNRKADSGAMSEPLRENAQRIPSQEFAPIPVIVDGPTSSKE